MLKKITKIVFFILFIFLSACGNGIEYSDETGSITFSVVWKGHLTKDKSSIILTKQDSELDCVAANVSTIEVMVFDENNHFLAQGGPWDCEKHEGIVTGIKAGDNRKVIVLGKGASEENLYCGEKTEVTVIAGQRNDIGYIDANLFVPQNIKAETGKNEAIITWDESLSHATSYNLYWSNTSGVTNEVFTQEVFSENFNFVIDPNRWKTWGDPFPTISTGEGREGSDALDCNGDKNYASGITSYRNFDLQDLTIVFWAKGSQTSPSWQTISVGIGLEKADVVSEQNIGKLCEISIELEESLDRIVYIGPGGHYQEDYFDDEWHHYKIWIRFDGYILFYRDGTCMFTSPDKVDLTNYNKLPIQIDGRSYNDHQLVDDLLIYNSNILIPGVSSPYAHSGLINGIDYYYVVTAVNKSYEIDIEGDISTEVFAIPTKWQYKKTIRIYPETPFADFQIKVLLDTFNFDYSNAGSQGQDIRFSSKINQISKLNYWIEDWDNTGTSTIWVKVNDPGTSTIYMFYGNDETISESDGDEAFDFFDDFENGDYSDKWLHTKLKDCEYGNDCIGYATWTEQDGKITVNECCQNSTYCSQGPGILISHKNVEVSSNKGFVLDVVKSIATSNAGHSQISTYLVGNSMYVDPIINYDWHFGIDLQTYNSNCIVIYYPPDVKYIACEWDMFLNTPYRYVNQYNGSSGLNTTVYEKDGNKIYSERNDISTYSETDPLKVMLYALSPGSFWDNIKIRKYASPEPKTCVGEYFISGRILGNICKDIMITLSGDQSDITAIDSNGNYMFCGLPNGSYTVTPNLDGYSFEPNSRNVSIYENNVDDVEFSSLCILCDIIFQDDFSTDKEWTSTHALDIFWDTNNQKISWQTARDRIQRFYHPIGPFSGDFILEAEVKITKITSNCWLEIGLANELDGGANQIPSGIAIQVGWWGGGTSTTFYYATFIVEYTDETIYYPYNFNIPSGFIPISEDILYTLKLTRSEGNLILKVYDSDELMGTLSGSLEKSVNNFQYIYIGNSDSQDWPTMNGYFDDIKITSSSEYLH